MYAHFTHSIIGEWAGSTAVDAPGHAHWEGTPQADIHQAGTLPTPGAALLVGAPLATAVGAPAAAPDLSPEADLDPHCHPPVGGAPLAQLVPLPGRLGSACAALYVCAEDPPALVVSVPHHRQHRPPLKPVVTRSSVFWSVACSSGMLWGPLAMVS